MTTDEVLKLWDEAVKIPCHRAPTLMVPLETITVRGGGLIAVHPDHSEKYSLLLLRMKPGRSDEVRGVMFE